MAYVLTQNSSIQCSHPTPGTVKVTGSTKLTVGGVGVLLIGQVPSGSISCAMPDDTSTKHCTSLSGATAGASSKLTVGGKPVALDTLLGPTDGTPAPITYSAKAAGQSKLTAV